MSVGVSFWRLRRARLANRALGRFEGEGQGQGEGMSEVQSTIVDGEFPGGAERTGRAQAPRLQSSNGTMHDDPKPCS